MLTTQDSQKDYDQGSNSLKPKKKGVYHSYGLLVWCCWKRETALGIYGSSSLYLFMTHFLKIALLQ